MRPAIALPLIAAGLTIGVAFAQTPDGLRVASVDADREQQLILPQVPLSPGASDPVWEKTDRDAEYDGNEEMIEAGKQLYAAMNCVGCHSHGGGGMGPALMDDTWVYGSSIEHIVSTIREGRPNGMPSFRGRLPDEQIWQIAAYVKSLSTEQR
jgi:cytochrome c oxidase cbb3-type subunit III